MKQSFFKRSLCLVLSVMSFIHVWAEGPEMNKVYTVPMEITVNNSYLIPRNAFLSDATSAIITVSNSSWVTFTVGYYGQTRLADAPYGSSSFSFECTGANLTIALNGNLYVSLEGKSTVTVTVLNKDANYVEPGTGGGTGDGGNTDDPTYTPDYTYQLDSDNDGKLEPCSEYPAFGAKVDYNKFPQLTDIPTIYLTTDNDFTWTAWTPKSEEYMNASIVIVDKFGTMKQRNETVTFRGRGNSTWDSGSKKKPWRLKFPEKTKLLAEQDANYSEINNYADAKSWTLLCNVYDKSLIRNAVSAELGKRYGMEFCPAYRFVDLVINGQYQGTYQVSDHVQVDKKRVNVDSKTGWFVEFSTLKFAEDPYISVQAGNQSVLASIKNPETSIATTSGATTDTQYDAMKEWIGKMWTNLCNGANEYNTNSKADYKAFRDMVDMKSLTGFVILQDLAGNYDGAMANVYAYKNATDDKLKFGPMWDLDLAYGNHSKLEGSHFWEAQSQGVGYLFGYMWKDPYFVKALYENWLAFKDGDKMLAFINGDNNGNNGKIDELAARIASSQAANYDTTSDSWRQWDNAWSISSSLSLGHGASSYAAAIQEIKDYISARSEWITNVYSKQYEALDCASLDPCADFGHNDSYVLQSDGSYRKGCDVCGTLSDADTKYYLFTIYPESKKTTTQYATSWQPTSDKPNSIAVVEAKQDVVERIEGWNIIAGKKNADGNLTCKDFRLTDGHPYYGDNKFVATTATYTRSITAGNIGTICLPYKMQNAKNTDAKFYHLKSISSDEMVLTPIQPEIEGNASAYVPVVFIPETGKTSLTVAGENITVKKNSALAPYLYSTAEGSNSEAEGWSIVGSMDKQIIDDVTTLKDEAEQQQYLYYFSGGKLYRATGKYTSNPFRAYFLSNINIFAASDAAASMRICIEDESATSIVSTYGKPSHDAIHLSRIYLPLPEGEYIINGKRVIITK